MKHKHKWEVARTIWPYEYGWGVYCKVLQRIIVTGLASKEDAAPDMYEALKAVLSTIVRNGDGSISYAIDHNVRQQIDKALAKAEGKTRIR